ncbi:MAG: hypothetical protein IJA61_00235 [Clostridia bacterium]|nr:hypothetical protein [Clostridia bacterium]
MYKYRIDDETTKKVVELANKPKKIEDNKVETDLINKINDYNANFEQAKLEIEAPVYERMEDVKIDNDKIKEQAENELYEYKKTSTDKINNDTVENINNLENSKIKLKDNFETEKANMDSYYTRVKQVVSDDALKRGLSRSSIVINQLDAFNKDQIENYNKLNKELTSSINSIDMEINNAKTAQENALNEFDITYAVKLQEKINSLTQDLLDKQEKVIKYNNEITEKEKEYEQDYKKLEEELRQSNWDKELDLMAYAGKYGTNMLEKYKTTQVYNIAKDYLKTLDSAVAISTLQNSQELKKLLGEENITKLLTELNK